MCDVSTQFLGVWKFQICRVTWTNVGIGRERGYSRWKSLLDLVRIVSFVLNSVNKVIETGDGTEDNSCSGERNIPRGLISTSYPIKVRWRSIPGNLENKSR